MPDIQERPSAARDPTAIRFVVQIQIEIKLRLSLERFTQQNYRSKGERG